MWGTRDGFHNKICAQSMLYWSIHQVCVYGWKLNSMHIFYQKIKFNFRKRAEICFPNLRNHSKNMFDRWEHNPGIQKFQKDNNIWKIKPDLNYKLQQNTAGIATITTPINMPNWPWAKICVTAVLGFKSLNMKDYSCFVPKLQGLLCSETGDMFYIDYSCLWS